MTTQAATNALNLRDLSQRLLAINSEAFGGGQYDIAYYALMAALHCMEVLRDVAGLGQVKQVAEEELAWIDAHAPDYCSVRVNFQSERSRVYFPSC